MSNHNRKSGEKDKDREDHDKENRWGFLGRAWASSTIHTIIPVGTHCAVIALTARNWTYPLNWMQNLTLGITVFAVIGTIIYVMLDLLFHKKIT